MEIPQLSKLKTKETHLEKSLNAQMRPRESNDWFRAADLKTKKEEIEKMKVIYNLCMPTLY